MAGSAPGRAAAVAEVSWESPGRTAGAPKRRLATRAPPASFRSPARRGLHEDHERVRRIEILAGDAPDVFRGDREEAVQVGVDLGQRRVEHVVVLQLLGLPERRLAAVNEARAERVLRLRQLLARDSRGPEAVELRRDQRIELP